MRTSKMNFAGLRSGMVYILIAIVLSGAACTFSSPEQDFPFYVGTYTDGESEGIYRYQLQKDGTLTTLGLAAPSENPSFLAKSTNGNYLLAVNEIQDTLGTGGTITSFSIKEDALTYVDKKSTDGASPCFVSINPSGNVLVANYSSGNVALLKLDASGMLSGPLDIQQHEGQGTNPRQKGPHAHSAWFVPDTEGIISVDLGTNELWLSNLDQEANTLVPSTPATLAMAPGAGPRHLAFHPNGKWIYVINELNATVTQVQKNSTGNLEIIASKSTLPADFTGESFCADIHISKDGKYLYASNRGHNSLAIFELQQKDGTMSLIGHEGVHGDWPRNFSLSPDEKYLLVANQRSNNIVSFKRDPTTGTLEYVSEIKAPSPVCLLF